MRSGKTEIHKSWLIMSFAVICGGAMMPRTVVVKTFSRPT
jgi:hypothetical protein